MPSPPRKTPPLGSPIPDDGEWENTPIGDIPRSPTSPSMPSSAPRVLAGSYSQQSESKASARAAFREIRKLGDKLDEHSRNDQTALERIHSKLEEQDATLASQGTTLTDIRIDAASTRATLETMTSEIRHRRELGLKVIDGELALRGEQEVTKRAGMSNQTKVWLALVAVLSTAVGAVVKWLVG